MKKYKIPVSWQMYGYMDIKAEDWDEAIEIAEDETTSLPDGDYVQGTFEVDHDIIEYEREEERQEIRRKVDGGFPTGNDAEFGTSME
tara:strand:+ start:657 stop:917 length:261 start_codon:yes stop_codon:yes gene_type:complete